MHKMAEDLRPTLEFGGSAKETLWWWYMILTIVVVLGVVMVLGLTMSRYLLSDGGLSGTEKQRVLVNQAGSSSSEDWDLKY